MRKKVINIQQRVDAKHSFLFWLILPICLVWLSASYIVGFIGERPMWLGDGNKQTTNVVSYFKEHEAFAEDLDQPFVTLWFDDAWLAQYTIAYPILKKYKVPGTIAVPINPIENEGYMNWAQVKVLQDSGWEVTNHSMDHDCQMDKWSREEILKEYINSKFILWKNNLASDIYVTPCGVDSKVMREEARKYFTAYRTVNPGFNDPKKVDFYDMKVKNVDSGDVDLEIMKSWIDEISEKNLWLIMVFHKVGERTGDAEADEFNVTEKDLDAIVKYIVDSNVKVVVPHQILASQNL